MNAFGPSRVSGSERFVFQSVFSSRSPSSSVKPEPADAGFLVGAERRLRVLADPLGELRAFVQEPGALDDAAHEVDAIRFFRVEPPPGDQEIERGSSLRVVDLAQLERHRRPPA